MAKIRVKVQPPDADNKAYHVHLPAYSMVPGSWQPIVAGRIDEDGVLATDKDGNPIVLTSAELRELSCEVLVPDDLCDEKGWLDKAKVRHKYRGQPRWDHDKVLDDI